MSTYITNESIKTHIVLPENCHCTVRSILTDASAVALCSLTGEVRAKLRWKHNPDASVTITWDIPLGLSYHKDIPTGADDAIIDSVIEAGFVAMHAHWEGSIDDG